MTDTYGELFGETYGGGVTVGASAGIQVKVDWEKTGDFDTYNDDVTDLLRTVGAPITATYGRDQSTALAPTVSGRAGLTLDNRDRRFSPRAATLRNGSANPLFGKLKPARPVRITRQIDGITYMLGNFHTDDTPINPDLSAKNVTFSLVDSLADFRGQNLSTQLYRGVRTGEAIGLILDACGWPADMRDLDPGSTIISWWWEDGTDALTALDKLVRSEGPPALLTIDTDGGIVFRDRHHRILDAASLTSQQTWGQGLVQMNGFSYDEAWGNLVNQGNESVDVRIPAAVQPVWTSDVTISVSEGESRLITASASDPFYDAIVPVAGTDFVATAGSVTVELLRTSGASATIKITGVGGDAVITGLQLRANPVPVAYAVQVSASDPVSIDDHGARSFPADLPWCNQYDAEAILATAVATRSTPRPLVEAEFMVGNDPAYVPLLGRDIGDRVTIIEAETSLNDAFFIETITHTFTGEHDHRVTFGLEESPDEPANVVRIGWAGVGIDQGVLGAGLDDPNLVIIVGSTVAGHRIGEGVTAS